MNRDRLHFLLLNIGHFLDHLFTLIFATVAALALSHAGEPSPLAWLAGAFTLVKTVLIYATLGAVSAGTIRWLWSRLRQ